ncbi:tail protein X [Rhodobacter capsulatus]|uniref:tail protein X n=1 Tax=Rhodobacter capsulatus TaxID=1061 RepID=UPI004025B36A
MATSYTTTGGEVLDQIALTHYGTSLGSTERLLAANPGLAMQPVILPPGVTIMVPILPATPAARPVKLYD